MMAARLDRSITVQTPTETQNSIGEPIKTWATLATVWASIKQPTGSESFSADRIAARTETIFRVRYRDDLTPKMRISYNGELWDITHIAEVGRREGLDISAVVHEA